MYQIFFELEMGICGQFPCMSPIDVRRERAIEVFQLVRRLNDYNSRRDTRSGERVVRRHAGDNWF